MLARKDVRHASVPRIGEETEETRKSLTRVSVCVCVCVCDTGFFNGSGKFYEAASRGSRRAFMTT